MPRRSQPILRKVWLGSSLCVSAHTALYSLHFGDRMMRLSSLVLLLGAAAIPRAGLAQVRATLPPPVTTTLLVPDRVWDGVNDAPHSGWAVLVTGNKIVAAAPRA